MKRLRDDRSSREESYDQSQIPESGLGGGGGGSRRANYKPKKIIDDALSYLKEVKDMFPDQTEKYSMFLEVMKDFKNRRIDTVDLIAKVKDLFKGHPSLILGLNSFLPKSYKIILNDDDEAPQRKTNDFDQAISLVNKIKERLGNGHEYKSFLHIFYMHRDGRKGIKEVYQEVSVLLNDQPDLLDEFTGFMPVDKIVGLHAEIYRRIEQSNLDNDKEQKTLTKNENRDRITRDEDHKDVQKVEDDLKCTYGKGFTYCEKAKERLGSSADYHAFLKCLHNYSREIIKRKELQSLVADTLGKYPDLMEDFNEFIERYERVGVMTNSNLVKEEVKDEEHKCKTGVPPTYQIKEENEASQHRSELDASSFLKKVKERFQNDDHVFKSFLDILNKYRVHKNINGVYHEVAILLNDQKDLLDEFTKFLPNSSS